MKVELEARGLTFVTSNSIGPDDPVTFVCFTTASGEEGRVSMNWEESKLFGGFQKSVAHQLDLWLDPVAREQEVERQHARIKARWGNGEPQDLCAMLLSATKG